MPPLNDIIVISGPGASPSCSLLHSTPQILSQEPGKRKGKKKKKESTDILNGLFCAAIERKGTKMETAPPKQQNRSGVECELEYHLTH